MKRTLITVVAAMLALGSFAGFAQAGNHQKTQGLQLDKIPSAVQMVIRQEAAEHPLMSIGMADDDETGVYECKFSDGSRQIELKIAADGKLVSREIEQGHKEDREENDD